MIAIKTIIIIIIYYNLKIWSMQNNITWYY